MTNDIIKRGLIVRPKLITPEKCRENPNALFVFGDNMMKKGTGGQACVRGEPNTIGVPTKWTSRRAEHAYFTDDVLKDKNVMQRINDAFDIILDHLDAEHIVFIPKDGLGTGLAELPTRAPKLFHILEETIASIERKYGVIPSET